MKIKISALLLFLALLLSGCAQNEMCTIDSAAAYLSDKDKAQAVIYSEDKKCTFAVTDEFIRLISDGQWKKAPRSTGRTKIVSVTLGTQYEICLFADGYAMIYNGFSGLFEKDRAYYLADVNTEAVVDYINAHFIEDAEESDTSA